MSYFINSNAMEIALISTTLFKEHSPIKDDTMIDKFVPYILLAQRMYLAQELGPALVEELQEQIKLASVTPAPTDNPITPANQALLLKIAPALAFYSVYQGLPFHWAAVVNKGITLGNSENSTSVDIKGLAQLRTWLRDDAEALTRDLVEYLYSCRATYPKWKPKNGERCKTGDGCGTDKPEDYDFGISIPRRGHVRRY